jgi:carbamoyl-phosphate synthase large subunit
MTTVLCTSVGNDGFQAIYRALKLSPNPIRIVGVDADPYAYGIYLSDCGYVVPPRSDAELLLSNLTEICRDRGVQLLLPLSTEDQWFFAFHQAKFELLGIVVAVSSLRSIEVANNKHLLFDKCHELGLPVPLFRHVSSRAELDVALADFQADSRPVVIKKQFSTGAQGVKIVRPKVAAAERLFSRDNIMISLDDLRRWSGQLQSFPLLQVSEFLPDARYSVDVFLNGGRARCAVVRTELSRVYGMSTAGAVVNEPQIEATGVAAAEALGFNYTVNVEIGLDREGEPKLFELNPRFPATIDHTVMAGCNMPLWTVAAALGWPYEVSQPKIGTCYRRYWNSLVTEQWRSFTAGETEDFSQQNERFSSL